MDVSCPTDFSKVKVLVVGDVMLDRYIWGNVERISPEAPVQVVCVTNKTYSLGGAGNVAANLSGLRCQVSLVSVIGKDSNGEKIINLLSENLNNIANFLVVDSKRPTTTKNRLLCQGQQLLRFDEENLNGFEKAIEIKLTDHFNDLINDMDAVIISDYNKGLFYNKVAAHIIKKCNRLQVPVFVDPKTGDFQRYSGSTCITPNLKEFLAAASLETLQTAGDHGYIEKIGNEMLNKYKLKHLLITKTAKGMSLISENQSIINIPTQAREVYDVSGAGDTVIATLAACVGAGLPIQDAAYVANVAAGIVVGKIGTHPVTKDELEMSFHNKEKI